MPLLLPVVDAAAQQRRVRGGGADGGGGDARGPVRVVPRPPRLHHARGHSGAGRVLQVRASVRARCAPVPVMVVVPAVVVPVRLHGAVARGPRVRGAVVVAGGGVLRVVVVVAVAAGQVLLVVVAAVVVVVAVVVTVSVG